jgi:hypothetical protein
MNALCSSVVFPLYAVATQERKMVWLLQCNISSGEMEMMHFLKKKVSYTGVQFRIKE